MIDISQRRRTEEALRQSEQRYRAVVDQSVVGIYLLDVLTKRVIEANPAFSHLLGYDLEDVRGLSLYDLAAHSEEEIDQNVGRVVANQHEYVGERRYRRKNGSIVDVDVFANLVRFDDREVFCVTCNDVTNRRSMETALRRSEAHFRSLIDNALDLITIVDGSGLMLYQSPSIERTLGYKPEELNGKSAFDFIHPEDAATVSEALGKIIEAPGATESSVFRFRHLDGSYRVLEAIGKTAPDNTGISGVVVNSRDITERRQLQEQLIRSEKLAAMGQLVSGVAHELNNPLTSVIGFTQLMMATGELDPKSLERLEIIRSQADRARRIVQNLLSFSRQKKPEKAEVDLNRLLEKVLELRAYYMQVNNIVVVRDFGELMPALADAAQIEQVFLNIIINAEQAILGVRRGGTIAINTSLRRIDGQTRVRIVIADDGPGITPEFLGRIFDPFFTTKSVGEGTGLGLSISYGIIKEHGGLLEVASEPG
ncbi:MAG: PAS domain S-box protein, partial [Blastocatellia bacterium]